MNREKDAIKESQKRRYERTMSDSSKSFPKYIFLFIIYVLCFVNLYNPNVEIIGYGLLFALHVIMSYSIISSLFSSTGGIENRKMYVLPQAMLYILSGMFKSRWDGGVSVRWVLSIGIILMLVSLIILMVVFYTLHAKFSVSGKPLDMGDPRNTKLKEDMKIMYITQTVIIWVIYSIYANQGLTSEIIDFYLFPKRKIIKVGENKEVCSPLESAVKQTKIILKSWGLYIDDENPYSEGLINGIYVILGFGLLGLSSYTVWGSDRLAKNTGSYYIPKNVPNTYK